MVSIFVSTGGADLNHWRWQTLAGTTDIESIGELKPVTLPSGVSFYAAVRRYPIPSVVLSLNDSVICGIVKSLYDCDGEMLDCIEGLRQIVMACLPGTSKDEPICAFVHRGGDSFIEANPRLAETWKALPDELKRTFVCVAITRGGCGENVVNSDWQKSLGTNQENLLQLPSSEKEVLATLDKWSKEKCPEFLGIFGHGAASMHALGNGKPEPPPQKSSDCDSASAPEVDEMHLDNTSKLHVWVFADNTCGCSEELCRKWINEQQSYFTAIPPKQFNSHVIPKLASGVDRMGAVRDVYHGIAGILETAIADAPPTDRFLGVLDARLYSNIGKDGLSSLKTVQGLLILAFPDVLWIPVFKNGDETAKNDIKMALDLLEGGFNPMFDGTGVRGALIQTHQPNSAYPYYRDDVAVTIDEERHFAELIAYTAFRFGYRAYPISTARLAQRILNVDAKAKLPSLAGTQVSPDATLIVFEDGFVEFPDLTQAENEKHLLGTRRDKRWPLLKSANLRILATASGSDELIAWEGKELAGEVSTNLHEECLKTNVPNTTIGGCFGHDDFKELHRGDRCLFQEWREKCRRWIFNLFAGGMGCVWVVDVLKFLAVIGSLVGILFCCPILLLPALFILFLFFGFFRKVISFLVSRFTRTQTFFKVRLQWRLYPKLYVDHVPRNEIHQCGERYWCLVQKPLGGIFGLRNQCGLPNGRGFAGQLDKDAVVESYKNALRGLSPTKTGEEPKSSKHSAHGMTLDVSTDLIRRASSFRDRSKGIEDAIHAAVLATCAYELLGHKTPALSIEALELRHFCEVMAECEFPGVRARMDMEDRLIDIHNSMSQICRAPNGDIREEMFESGMAAICDRLSEFLRSRGRSEEAAYLSRQSRHMHRLLLNPFLRNILAFPEWAVRSKINFFTSLTIFLGVFAIYYKIRIDTGADFSDVLAKMYELLFSTQPNMDLTEIMATAKPRDVKTVVEISESLQLAVFNVDPELKERISSATVVVQAMRQLALIHIGFLAALFYDFMHRK